MGINNNNQGASKLLITIGVLAFFVGLSIFGYVYYFLIVQKEKNLDQNIPNSQSLDDKNDSGTGKDEHGCAIDQGLSWCEATKKCIVTAEEKCEEIDKTSLVEEYITKNISTLSPKKEVLGGHFLVTKFDFKNDDTVEIDYEDGHIALSATLTYEINNGAVNVKTFSIIDSLDIKKIEEPVTHFDDAEFTSEVIAPDGSLEQIKELLTFEYGVKKERIIAQVSDDRGEFARGEMVVMNSANEEIKGKFFVKKTDNKYSLVETSAADIDCEVLKEFPKDMVSECD